VREVEIGLVPDATADEAALAIARTLEARPVDEGHPMKINVGGGKWVAFDLIGKFERFKHKWRYDDDLRFVLRVTTDGNSIDTDQLLRSFSAVEGEWRVLSDR
jgi:hypothetical protein